MDDSESLPDHLAGGATFDEAEFLFSELTPSEAASIHSAIAELAREFEYDGAPNSTRYFVLGNYDDPQKERVRRAARVLEREGSENVAVLLDDLDPDDDYWENFYAKFRFVLSMSDYVVVVAEDNDGGHELELGEVPLADTFVLKRDYSSASIEDDVEREKYDAMLAKLCELLARNERLFEWCSVESLDDAVKSVASATG